MDNNASSEISQDSKNMALVMWLITIPLGFLSGLLFYLLKKDDAYVQDQAKEALNWSITAVIAYIVGFVLTFVLIGVLVMFALGICHLVFCIMGAIAASSGKPFRVPFTLRLLK